MCGFVGILNYKEDLRISKNTIEKMNKTLTRRGPDEEGYYIDENILMGHRRLAIIDLENGKQPMIEKYSNEEYIIIYNGQIYNTEELKLDLEKNNITVNTTSDTEILLKSYILYKEDVCKHLNGIFSFAIWNKNIKELFIARDHFGVKPFFYTTYEDSFIIASELKAIFAYPNFQKIIDKQGISELFGIGPAHTPGTTIFKNIFELKPAHYAIINKNGINAKNYWKLESKEHTDSFRKNL